MTAFFEQIWMASFDCFLISTSTTEGQEKFLFISKSPIYTRTVDGGEVITLKMST